MKLLREVSEKAEADALRQLIEAHCSATAKAGNIFWRGTGSDLYTFVVRDSASRGERQSLTGNNAFLSWTMFDTKWKSIPRRANSIIASTDATAASYFGNLAALIPFDGTKIAVLHGDDMNDANGAFRERITHQVPNDALGMVVAMSLMWLGENGIIDDARRQQLRQMAWNDTPRTLEEIQRHVDSLDQMQKKAFCDTLALKSSHSLPGIEYTIKQTQNVLHSVSAMFDPKGVLTVFDSTQTIKVSSPTSEVWFEGKCILVPVEQPHLEAVVREYKKFG